MADQKIAELKRVPLFAQCSSAELQALARNADEIDFAAGKTLIERGRGNDTFFILLHGEVTVEIPDHGTRRLGPGDFFGEMSMLDRGPATATVTTATPIEALVLSHAQFHNAIKGNEQIALQVLAVMAARLRENSATME
jgi:CRP-like cAMP-binding protein